MVVVMEELRIVDVDVMTIIIIAVALCVLKWMMIAAVMMLLAAVKMRIVMGLIKVNVFLRQAAAWGDKATGVAVQVTVGRH